MKSVLKAAAAVAAAGSLTAPSLASGWKLDMVAGIGYDTRARCIDRANSGYREYERRFREISELNSSSSTVYAFEIGGRNGLDSMAACIPGPDGRFDMMLVVYADDGRESERHAVMDRLRDIIED